MTRMCAVFFLFLAACPVMVQAEPFEHWSAGFHRLSFLDPLDDQPMHAIAFYPSSDPDGETHLGNYTVQATEEAKIALGHFPMLMLSHGNTGNCRCHAHRGNSKNSS